MDFGLAHMAMDLISCSLSQFTSFVVTAMFLIDTILALVSHGNIQTLIQERTFDLIYSSWSKALNYCFTVGKEKI